MTARRSSTEPDACRSGSVVRQLPELQRRSASPRDETRTLLAPR
jgi:hypothetical protein